MKYWRQATGAALGLVLSVGTMGLAQVPETATTPVKAGEKAAKLYSNGVLAAKRGQWPAAYEAYREAWRIKPHFSIAASLARAELRLGKHRDAAEHLALFLRDAHGVTEAERAAAQRLLGEAKSKIGTLTLVVRQERAEVLVDGVPVGMVPLGHDVYVEPGKRTIEARFQGEPPAKISVELSAGATRQVELRFEAPTAPALVSKRPKPLPPPPRPVPLETRQNDVLVIGGIVATSVAAGLGAGFAATSQSRGTDRDALVGRRCGSSNVCEKLDRNAHNRFGHAIANLANGSFCGFAAEGALGAGTVVLAVVDSGRRSSGSGDTVVSLAVKPAQVALMRRW